PARAAADGGAAQRLAGGAGLRCAAAGLLRPRRLSQGLHRPDLRARRPFLDPGLEVQPPRRPPRGLRPGAAGGGDAGPWLPPAAPALHRRPAPSPRPQPGGLRLRDALRRRALPFRARRAAGLAARRPARRRVPSPLPRRHRERARWAAFRPRRPARRGGRMNDLADGFARHLVDWATTLGAPADSLALLD